MYTGQVYRHGDEGIGVAGGEDRTVDIVSFHFITFFSIYHARACCRLLFSSSVIPAGYPSHSSAVSISTTSPHQPELNVLQILYKFFIDGDHLSKCVGGKWEILM